MNYEKWRNNAPRFLAMTGCTIDEFQALIPAFEIEHEAYFSRYHRNGKRRTKYRKFVIYKNSPLPTIADRLVFILSYLKLNPIQEAHAALFDMEQKVCNEFIHSLKEVLVQTLKRKEVQPAETQAELEKKVAELTDLQNTKLCSEQNAEQDKDIEVANTTTKQLQDEITVNSLLPISAKLESNTTTETTREPLVLLHDGTEREIPRPQDEDKQKETYSGKKKKHTVKNAVITTLTGLIVFISATVIGTMHDKKMADTLYAIPQGCELWQDSGYQGYAPEGVKIVQPTKKPKGKELSEEQKADNQAIASVRVRVEHAIGSVKRYRIVKDECRLRKKVSLHQIFVISAGLHNFRLSSRPFNYPEHTKKT